MISPRNFKSSRDIFDLCRYLTSRRTNPLSKVQPILLLNTREEMKLCIHNLRAGSFSIAGEELPRPQRARHVFISPPKTPRIINITMYTYLHPPTSHLTPSSSSYPRNPLDLITPQILLLPSLSTHLPATLFPLDPTPKTHLLIPNKLPKDINPTLMMRQGLIKLLR
jgi:hypothetical protein